MARCASVQDDSEKRAIGLEPTTFTLATATHPGAISEETGPADGAGVVRGPERTVTQTESERLGTPSSVRVRWMRRHRAPEPLLKYGKENETPLIGLRAQRLLRDGGRGTCQQKLAWNLNRCPKASITSCNERVQARGRFRCWSGMSGTILCHLWEISGYVDEREGDLYGTRADGDRLEIGQRYQYVGASRPANGQSRIAGDRSGQRRQGTTGGRSHDWHWFGDRLGTMMTQASLPSSVLT